MGDSVQRPLRKPAPVTTQAGAGDTLARHSHSILFGEHFQKHGPYFKA